MRSSKSDKSTNISIIADSIIRLDVQPHPTPESIIETAKSLNLTIAELRNTKKKIYLLINVKRLSLKANTKANRTATRQLLLLDVNAVAVVGPIWAIQTGMYIGKLSGIKKPISFFRTENSAKRWMRITEKKPGLQTKVRTQSLWIIFIIFIIVTQVVIIWSAHSVKNDFSEHQSILFSSRSDQVANILDKRLDTYVDTLHSFKGLYDSSETVSSSEFKTFYNDLNVASKYPGFRAFSYIRKVPSSNIPGFVEEQNNNLQVLNPGTADRFTIKGQTNKSTHYIVTYIASPDRNSKNINKSLGLDLSYDPVRLSTYNKVAQTKQPSASDTTIFNISGEPPANGFFISIPIFNNQTNFIGVVNAVVFYDAFFEQFATDAQLGKTNNISMRIVNADGKEVLYESDNFQQKNSDGFYSKKQIKFADRAWTAEFRSSKPFEASPYQALFANQFLIGAEILLLFCYLFIVGQLRVRSSGYELADRITDDLQSERTAALNARRQDDVILASIGDGVIVTDAHGKITMLNKTAENLLHVDDITLLDKRLTTVVDVVTREGKVVAAENRPITQVLRTKQPFTSGLAEGLRYKRKDGSVFPLSIKITPLYDKKVFIGTVVVIADLTSDAEFEATKDDFMSIVSHQLQTPASVVKQFLGLIVQGFATTHEERLKLVERAYDANEEQLSIISDLLEAARLESGKSVLKEELIEINQFVKSITSKYKNLNNPNNSTVEYSEHRSSHVNVDALKLRMSIDNLISNAMKYNKINGRVNVWIDMTSRFISIHVKDEGIGISEEDQKKLFKRFSRISNSSTDNITGSGIGLYLVKQVVDLHNGKIDVISRVGNGTEFVIKLPIKHGGKIEHDENVDSRG